jgi:hypothetical protein
VRIGHLQQTRPHYYDRNPAIQHVIYAATGVAPHGGTSRATYTVPSGKKAIVEAAHVAVTRQTAAAPVGLISFRLTIAGANLGSLYYMRNAVGDYEQLTDLTGGLFPAGTAFDLDTTDASTGGTCAYHGGVKIMEFDA